MAFCRSIYVKKVMKLLAFILEQPPYFTLCVLLVVVVGFVALRPKSTAMVIVGRSVHLTTRFPGQA